MSKEENFLRALLAAIRQCEKVSASLDSLTSQSPRSRAPTSPSAPASVRLGTGVLDLVKSLVSRATEALMDRDVKRVEAFSVGFEIGSKELSVAQVTEKLLKFVAALPPEDKPILLIVDEANRFRSFAERNSSVLSSFLGFVVEVSKEKNIMPVVFTASDSYFDRWLKNKGVDTIHFTTMVLGDLTRDESYRFYQREVSRLELAKQELFLKNEEGFAEVFNLTGGRMFHIKQYIRQVSTSGPIFSPDCFWPVENEITFLEGELIRPSGNYDKALLLKVFKLMTTSKVGYLTLKDFSRELLPSPAEKAQEQELSPRLSDLVANNIVILRPKSNLSLDLYPEPKSTAVTAKSQPALKAMEILLEIYCSQ
eukprot:CAMPEP_0184645278 /NCGR_PEP_ID=MMETSP0308-20130426/1773_1 /TAXON_ID=38269 /ORGANISM="Gloeochaete witrockiana, Strain SAG 46.84" /LENGTH=366 /DNA_ID=CAMNT_0027074169 /DNA_START=451 /DNA_END=1551 /DNA_ORIENTATION=+